MKIVKLKDVAAVRLTDSPPLKRDHDHGTYFLVGNGRSPRGFSDKNNIDANVIIVSRTGSYGNISQYDLPVFLTNESFWLDIKDDRVSSSYLFYHLKYLIGRRLKRRSSSPSRLSSTKLAETKLALPCERDQRILIEYFANYEKYGGANVDSEVDRILKEIGSYQNGQENMRSLKSLSLILQILGWSCLISGIVFAISLLPTDKMSEYRSIIARTIQHPEPKFQQFARWMSAAQSKLFENSRPIFSRSFERINNAFIRPHKLD